MSKINAKNLLSRNQYRKVAKDVNHSMASILNSSLENTSDCSSTGNVADRSLSSAHYVQIDLDSITCFDGESTDVTDCEHSSEITCERTFEGTNNNTVSDNSSVDSLALQLGNWAITDNIPLKSLGNLLGILRNASNKDEFASLPKDPRTLLKTPSSSNCRDLGSGKYYYFGIENSVINLVEMYNLDIELLESIELAINIDGLPLTKSTGDSFWPILGVVKSVELLKEGVFIVALFCGTEKPSANELITDFIVESVHLNKTGIKVGNVLIPFKITMLICDTPAKSYILSTKGHNGYFSCTMCCAEGTYFGNVICFSETGFVRRLDKDFRAKTQEEHHLGISLFENLPEFDLIRNVPLDYMHVVLLGVVKRLICHKKYGWVFGKPPYKLRARNVLLLNRKLNNFRKFIPREFSGRKTRNISEAKRFKATEFRLFLLYTGVVALKNVVSNSAYCNFLILSVATSLMLGKDFCHNETYVSYAESLMEHFILNCKKIYDLGFITLNVHSLLHLADCVRDFGSLDNFSAFIFENHMQLLKKKVRKNSHHLQQVVKRVAEEKNLLCRKTTLQTIDTCHQAHHNGPLTSDFIDPQYRKLSSTKFTINSNKFADSFVELYDGTIVQILNIATYRFGSDIGIIGYQYERTGDFFSKPCPSSFLSISVIGKINGLSSWNAKLIKRKLLVLPSDNNFVCFPLLHL